MERACGIEAGPTQGIPDQADNEHQTKDENNGDNIETQTRPCTPRDVVTTVGSAPTVDVGEWKKRSREVIIGSQFNNKKWNYIWCWWNQVVQEKT